MDEKLILNNHLKEIRIEKKLSQSQLAEMVGVSRNTISSIETGQFNPTAKLALILCIALDRRLNAYVGGKNITYTRYADDMIFSAQSRERLLRARSTIEEIIKDEKFLLNDEKTRLLGPGQQIKLTGLVISTHQQKDKTIGVGREEKRIIRAKLHKLINSQAEETAIMHLKGWLNYLNSVDPDSLKYLKEYSRKFSGLNENDELLVRLFPNSTEPQTRSKQ